MVARGGENAIATVRRNQAPRGPPLSIECQVVSTLNCVSDVDHEVRMILIRLAPRLRKNSRNCFAGTVPKNGESEAARFFCLERKPGGCESDGNKEEPEYQEDRA